MTKNAKLSSLNDHMVGQFVRVLLAVSLQIIYDVFMDSAVWAFSLAADASTHLGVPLFDQRIRMCLKGVL
jgi:putative effector of murein hydrolase